MQATLKWTGGLQFVGQTDGGPAVVLESGDSRSAPSPMQFVLMGVAGCTAVDVVSILNKMRVDVSDMRIEVSGTRAEEPPRRFTRIHIEYIITGAGIAPSKVERAISLSEGKYCSAISSLNADFSHSYQIIDLEQKSKKESEGTPA
jgi:putative redox protein